MKHSLAKILSEHIPVYVVREVTVAVEKFKLVFHGMVAEGADISEVKDNLRLLMKTDAATVERMFNTSPVTIKNSLDYVTALKFQAVFEKTGARCAVESLVDIGRPHFIPELKPTPNPRPVTRRLDLSLPKEFEAVKDRNEEILWVGKPNFIAFIIRGIPLLVLGLIWGSIDYFGFIRNSNIPLGFGIPFFALHLLPLWAGILNMMRLLLVHRNTCYAFSNKRMMMRSGFWGTDFKAIDYDKISDIEVNVNPVENMLGVGTIQTFSGRVSDKDGRIYDQFIGIKEPYEVFKRIKEVSLDVKTDISYPNALRPHYNPGYSTSYRERE
jgi:hypothetical protein